MKTKIIGIPSGGEMVCDFCGSLQPTWTYPCKDYEVFQGVKANGEKLVVGSLGHWAACALCHELVERVAKSELAARSVQSMVEMGKWREDDVAEWQERLQMVQDTFWWNRTGSAIDMGEK